MLLGMTAKTNESEKPQGPATSFVVACAFAPVAGALGYKKDRPFDAHGGCGIHRKPTNCRSLGPPTRTRDFLNARAPFALRETRLRGAGPRDDRAPETHRGIRRKASAAKYALRLRGCAATLVNARKLLMPMTFARRAANENARATSLRMTLCAHGGLVMTAKANECEKPQGPATFFVVACACAPVAGALGYKGPPPRGSLRGSNSFQK
jgi:hypothetical protein